MSAAVWKMVPTCLFWRERNNRSFEDLERSSENIISSFFHTLYLWTAAFISPLMISYDDLLLSFLFLVRCLLLYIAGVLKGALRF
jgi:hypothetical protein